MVIACSFTEVFVWSYVIYKLYETPNDGERLIPKVLLPVIQITIIVHILVDEKHICELIISNVIAEVARHHSRGRAGRRGRDSGELLVVEAEIVEGSWS